MKRASLIYNPVAGKRLMANKLDSIIDIFQSGGWQLKPYRTSGSESRTEFAELLDRKDYDAIIVAGGDGTINQVVNGMLLADIEVPLGILPLGTANDFAMHMNLPTDIEKCAEIILGQNITNVDVGSANGRFFINIASAGLLSDVSHLTDVGMKNIWGRMAYYFKGIEKLPNLHPIPVEIITPKQTYIDEVLMFLITNGRTAGGFQKIAPLASITDGLFDVVLVKNCNLPSLLSLFIKLMKGEHINDPLVEYFQTNELKINCLLDVATDIDGEEGPAFPLDVKILSGRLKVFCLKEANKENISKPRKKVQKQLT